MQGYTPLIYIQPSPQDLLFSPFLADGRVLGSNITLRFTAPGRAQIKMRQHPYGSVFFFFLNKAYYTRLIKVYTLALEWQLKDFTHPGSPDNMFIHTTI